MTTCPRCNHTWGEKSPRQDVSKLDAPLPKPARKWPVDSFVATWADGTQTKVSSVPYKGEAMKWAAAFQAADRLRRLRTARKLRLAKSPGATVKGPCGVTVRSPQWWDYVKAMPAPALAELRAESGDVLQVPLACAWGAGDPERAEAAKDKMRG